MDTVDIPKAVKEAVQRIDPTATVILYGSRARGDAQPDSDWDFMVVHDAAWDRESESRINSALLDIEIDTGAVIVALDRTRSEWDSSIYQVMPFHNNVVREGMVL